MIFHHITIPEVLKSFSFFTNYLPPQVHLVLISRSEPGLELAKLRLAVDRSLRLTVSGRGNRQFYNMKGLTFEREELARIEQYTQFFKFVILKKARRFYFFF
jgi:ATP/maltotriose-dependent transcriptional regulator MalT